MFYWDPRPEVFKIPYFNIPILWYGLLFALGFALGFPVFVSLLRRFFFNDPEYKEIDILSPEELSIWGKTKESICKALNRSLLKERITIALPRRVKEFVKKSNCFHPQQVLARLSLDLQLKGLVLGLYRKAELLTDRLVVYVLIGTVVGARLGHLFFYERPSEYISDPLGILRVWEGGLASHGAALGIMIALAWFAHRTRNEAKGLTWLRLLDFVAIPTALCGGFIRIGNFFNQEVLGRTSTLPWAITFGHPADHSFLAPRHPVQLYEALFYFFVFILLWRLSFRRKILLSQGTLIGLFLILVFGFRFLIEFLKVEQSHLLASSSSFTMGQFLSIPLTLLGVVLLLLRKRRRGV